MARKPLKKSTKENKSAAGSNIEVGSIEVGGNVAGNLIVGHGNIINLPPEQQIFRSLHQLPQPPADFTGREELIAQLLADFEKGRGATITGQPIHGLTGMGGIGKTALGLVVAQQLKQDYPDAQIFLDLKGTTTPLSALDAMRHVILSFEPTADLRTLDEAGMTGAYQTVLAGKRALLFLDNARSGEQVAPLRPPGTCAFLLTSRWSFGVPGLYTHHLHVMSAENAGAFLLELCPRIGSKAHELAKACAYLPLALRIAGSFLQVNENWKVEKYLVGLNDRKGRLATLEESYEEAELKAEPDLLATFELSYNALSDEDKKRWRRLGVFPTSFDASAAAAMWDLDPEGDETKKALGLLLRYSLLDYDETSSRYSLHDLLVDFSLMKMEEGEEVIARVSHSAYYSDVLGNINQMYLRGGENILPALRLYDAEWINVEAGQRISAMYLEEDRQAAQACNRYAGQGFINELRLKPKDQIKWIEAGLRAARVLKNKKAEGTHLGNLGIAYRNLGETRKAIEFYEQDLAIAREIGNRGGEGAALGNLGIAYYSLGETYKAIEFHEQALVIVREIGDRRGEGNVLGNLGVAYYKLGKTREAIEFHEEGLTIAREIGDRHGEGQALGNLGIAYAVLGEAHKAIEFYKQWLVIMRELGNRGGEGQALGNLGIAYAVLGETRKAIEFFEGALIIDREMGDRGGEGADLINMGLALDALKEKKKAIELVRQALQIFEAIESPYAELARNKLNEWEKLQKEKGKISLWIDRIRQKLGKQ